MRRCDWDLMYEVAGAAMEVHRELGRGLDELIYQEAFEIELLSRNIEFTREKVLNVYYKGKPLKKFYKVDFFSNGVMIELKSVPELTSEFRAQLFNYMRITKVKFGMLINFGERSLRTERYEYQPDTDDFLLINRFNKYQNQ